MAASVAVVGGRAYNKGPSSKTNIKKQHPGEPFPCPMLMFPLERSEGARKTVVTQYPTHCRCLSHTNTHVVHCTSHPLLRQHKERRRPSSDRSSPSDDDGVAKCAIRPLPRDMPPCSAQQAMACMIKLLLTVFPLLMERDGTKPRLRGMPPTALVLTNRT